MMESKKKKNPIEEARRYVANAKEAILKAICDPDTSLYNDKKYVKTAGNVLWSGCLVALDAVFQVREGKGRPSIEKYKKVAAARDRKLLAYIDAGYDTLHLSMGYDGTRYKKTCDAGFELANAIIDRCALLYHPEEGVA